MVKWYHKSLPSLRCGFDSRYPLQNHPIFSINKYKRIMEIALLRALDLRVRARGSHQSRIEIQEHRREFADPASTVRET